MSNKKLTPETYQRLSKSIHELFHKNQLRMPITFPLVNTTQSGRIQAHVPNIPNGPFKVAPGRMSGKMSLNKVQVDRTALKRALYGTAYGRALNTSYADASVLDVRILPPEGTNPGFELACLEGCSQQLQCATGHDLPMICKHCRTPATFLRKILPYLSTVYIDVSSHDWMQHLGGNITVMERAQLQADLCDPDDTVPPACPLFLHALLECPRCQSRKQMWTRGVKVHRADRVVYLYGGPDGPHTTFKGWAMQRLGKGRGSIHDKESWRHARRTERKKFFEDASKQQQARRRSSRSAKKRKKTKR